MRGGGQGDLAELALPCLMLVTDRTLYASLDELVRAVVAAVGAGVNAVQVREKDLSAGDQVALVRRLVEAVGAEATVVLNGEAALALEAGATGVHGSEDAPEPAAVRRATKGRLLIGRSVHGVAAAVDAARAGVDYLVVGTIFPSRSHPNGETGGLARIAAIRTAVGVPVIAIGGITPVNAGDVVCAGADGVAVISAILGRPDPRAAAAALCAAVAEAYRTVSRSARARAVGAGGRWRL